MVFGFGEPELRILVSRPAKEVPVFDLNGGRKYLNRGERQAYLVAIRSESDEARRAFLMTLFYTGCRISEGLNLQVRRIDLAAKSVTFETLKRRKSGVFRSVPIPDELATLLRKIAGHKSPNAKIWGLFAFHRLPYDRCEDASRSNQRRNGDAKRGCAMVTELLVSLSKCLCR